MTKVLMSTGKHLLLFETLLTILIPILGMAMGVGAMYLFGLNQTDYGNLIVNLFFLAGVVTLVSLFRFSTEDLGLKVIKDQMQIHATFSLAIFTFYMLFYFFIIRISILKPISSNTLWGLVTILIVVIAEEAYFRGALYSFFERRFSAKTALIVSSILFGLFHAQQGLRGVISKIFTGWLWGSIRYSTGMIFLLIIGWAVGSWITPGSRKDAQLTQMSAEIREMREMMVLTLIDQSSVTQRIKAVNLTNSLDDVDERVIQALLKTLNNDPNENVRLVTVEALYEFADNAIVREGLIQSISKQESALVQLALADVMVALHEKRSIEQFNELLKRRDLNDAVRGRIEKTVRVLL